MTRNNGTFSQTKLSFIINSVSRDDFKNGKQLATDSRYQVVDSCTVIAEYVSHPSTLLTFSGSRNSRSSSEWCLWPRQSRRDSWRVHTEGSWWTWSVRWPPWGKGASQSPRPEISTGKKADNFLHQNHVNMREFLSLTVKRVLSGSTLK